MHRSISRYVLPTVTVTALAAFIAPVVAQAPDSPQPVEHSTPSQPVMVGEGEPVVIEPVVVEVTEPVVTEPILAPVMEPVMEPVAPVEHSTPEVSGGVDHGASSIALMPSHTIKPCSSDGPSEEEAPCYWDASAMGNAQGSDFILWTDGQMFRP